jgi:hypothetical protein
MLGAKMPAYCADLAEDDMARGVRCVGWFVDRFALVSGDETYDDPALAAYVAGVGARVARAADLGYVPTVRVAEPGGHLAFARPGGFIYVARDLLAVLGSEAELAAVIAHEVAHTAAGHVDDVLEPGPATRDDALDAARERDEEAIADEIAVGYLARAGYSPDAMRTMLHALARAGGRSGGLDDKPEPDDDYPSMASRLARVTRLIAGRTTGEIGRDRYLDRVAGLVVGDDPRRGQVVDRVWTSSRAGVEIAIPPGLDVDSGDRRLVLSRRGGATVEVTLYQRTWGDVIAGLLKRRRTGIVAGHAVVSGLLDERATAVIAWRERSVMIAADGPGAAAARDAIVAAVRATTASSPRPARLILRRAVAPGTAGELATACVAPTLAAGLDDPARAIAAGERFKCVE